jgi:hypothetical protein
MGSLVSWSHLSLISAVIPALFTVCVLFIPESPYYLLAHGKTDEAMKSLKWLRGAVHEEQIIKKNKHPT